jgi:hypothetical protein
LYAAYTPATIQTCAHNRQRPENSQTPTPLQWNAEVMS